MLVRVLERVRTVAPLGIRFWDMVTDAQVSDQLVVTARLANNPHAIVMAQRTKSGVYAVSGLPGLRPLERPFPDDDPIAPESLRCWVTVIDEGARFAPMLFGVNLPLPYKGVFPINPDNPQPETNPPGVYLFSTPTRPVQTGIAALYTTLAERNTGVPAAYAVIEVTAGGQTWMSLADARGNVAVLFPYPPFAPNLRPAAQTWDVNIRVRYQPSVVQFPLQTHGLNTPDLRTQSQQDYATIRRTTTGNTAPTGTLTATLHYGQPLILRTAQADTLNINPV